MTTRPRAQSDYQPPSFPIGEKELGKSKKIGELNQEIENLHRDNLDNIGRVKGLAEQIQKLGEENDKLKQSMKAQGEHEKSIYTFLLGSEKHVVELENELRKTRTTFPCTSAVLGVLLGAAATGYFLSPSYQKVDPAIGPECRSHLDGLASGIQEKTLYMDPGHASVANPPALFTSCTKPPCKGIVTLPLAYCERVADHSDPVYVAQEDTRLLTELSHEQMTEGASPEDPVKSAATPMERAWRKRMEKERLQGEEL